MSCGCVQAHDNNLSSLTKNTSNETVAQLNQLKSIPEPKLIKNESVVNNISLTIRKAIYEKGEKIEALFKFDGELFIHPYIRIYKFENETWNFLGMWDFNGTQYVCCGMVPMCSKYFSSESSPLNSNWDQKIVEEQLPVLTIKNIIKKQVDSGKYKIRVVYGDRPVCTYGIEAEFLIK